jgi:sodium/potassium-transporting ATPase subunit alpha
MYNIGLETIMVLLVDVGTDLAPAVSLAYEEPEAAIMEQPPRDQVRDHIVGLRLMIIAYGTMGILESFAAFFAFFWVYHDYGFWWSDLIGAGPNYRDHYDCTYGNDGCETLPDDRRRWFDNLCIQTPSYRGYRFQDLGPNADNNFCATPTYNTTSQLWQWTRNDLTRGEDFRDYLQEVLGQAQTAFLMTVVFTQVANLLMRKTMKASLWTFGIRSNKVLLYCLVSMIILICLLVYIPGLNEGLLLRPLATKNAIVGLWMLPFMILFEETRKSIIRTWPGGIMERLTKF